MNIFTIGFTKKNAQTFFEHLKKSKVQKLVDVRLHNVSQLAGYAKRDDLKFFLKEICNAEYEHIPELAPDKSILDDYKKKEITWEAYEEKFLNLMSQRNVEREAHKILSENTCLLCSEHKPHQCHRRLVVEYLNETTDLNLQVKHLY